MDEPHSAISAIPLRLLSRLARKHCKVVLSGEGADETLAGYDLHSLGRLADRRRRLYSWMPRPVFKMMSKIVPGDRSETLEAMARYGWSGYLRTDRKPAHMAFAFNKIEKSRIWREHTGLDDSEKCIQSWYDLCPSDEPLDIYLQVHCRSWLSECLLWRADKMSMAESLELRVPFLDHHLVEWVATMPMAWRVGDRMSGYESKRVLRNFVRKRLPPSVDELPKMGWAIPSSNWFDSTQELGRLADKYLLKKGTAFDALFDISEVATLLNRVRSGHGDSVGQVLLLLSLARWLHSNA